MSARIIIGAAAFYLAATAAYASSCDSSWSQQYRDCVRQVDSLRPDKAGQARVFAADGSEFTAGQALWMQGQLRKVARLCASDSASDHAEAERTLTEIRGLLQSHHRDS
jgi:hypothetical protein